MREIITVTNLKDWEQSLRACEHNEILAAAFPVMDAETAQNLLTQDDYWSIAFDKTRVAKTELPGALAIIGESFEEIIDSPNLRLGGMALFGDTELHLDYYPDQQESRPLKIWYGVVGEVEATFVPLSEGEYPELHIRPPFRNEEVLLLPKRIHDRLDFNTDTLNKLGGIVSPEDDGLLSAERIHASAGTLLAFSGVPSPATNRLPVAHQFLKKSDYRISIPTSARKSFA